ADQLSVSERLHEHRGVAQKYAIDREAVEVAHYPVHLVQESSEVLPPSRNLDPLNLLDRPHPCMIEIGSIDDRGSLDHRNTLDNISELNNLLDPSVNIAGVRGNVNNDVAIHLHDQPHVS